MQVGVCDIYIYIVCDIIVVVVLTMCNLTIEYFAKTMQNAYRVHARISLTLRGD